MPNVLKVGSYYIYFWTEETNEPIPVHISKGKPATDATKIWLTKSGGAIVSHNKSRIPQHELNKLLEIIEAQHFFICRKWQEMFGPETLKFYC